MLTDLSGQSVPISSFGGTLLLGELAPGTYLLMVSGWDQDQAAGIAYQLSCDLVSAERQFCHSLVSGPPCPRSAIRRLRQRTRRPRLRHRRR